MSRLEDEQRSMQIKFERKAVCLYQRLQRICLLRALQSSLQSRTDDQLGQWFLAHLRRSGVDRKSSEQYLGQPSWTSEPYFWRCMPVPVAPDQ